VDTGLDGRVVVDGPSTVAGVVVVQIGLTSEAVGAAGLPAICGGWAAAWAVPKKVAPPMSAATRTAAPSVPPRAQPLFPALVPARSIPLDRLNIR